MEDLQSVLWREPGWAGVTPTPACSPNSYRSMPPMQRYLTSRNSSMPYFEPSRPMPLSFMPPKGAISVEMMPSLMPTMPYSSASATHQMRPMTRPVERGGNTPPQPSPAGGGGKGWGVVGHLDHLVFGLEAVERHGSAIMTANPT